MRRSIKVLREGNTLGSDGEIRAAALRFVRKFSGYRKPARANEQVFDTAADEVFQVSLKLLSDLQYRGRAARRQDVAVLVRERAEVTPATLNTPGWVWRVDTVPTTR